MRKPSPGKPSLGKPSPAAITLAFFLFFGLTSCLAMTVQGKVAVKGSEPHTYLALSAEQTEYSLVGPLAEDLSRNYQGKYLRVRGEIIKEALGPGFPAEFEVQEIIEVSGKPFS